ncbi:transporter substrate-binding domain-containing protein [Pseudomonas chlororaphis subsp. aurantiaca]|uniref:transporter substrate-binding domain-containing protein n=1 Tax=Pseudomonas chlororaphis TaxID=587753 RepID=UPI0027DDB98A|nr:transporter substrate-binding domain-containing protein [Pseudomonas chlororaphis]WMI98148.1 transporter substrate-binding domain-containing protein [Pseudomonas chlororaphis subsp. aurantiaca]
MKNPLRLYLCLALFLLPPVFAGAQAFAAAEPEAQTLQLLGRSSLGEYQVGLAEADWSWLRKKGTLYLGVSAPDYPPFDVTGNGRDYEGLTADYMGLLAQLLHVQVQVRRFKSRTEVIRALKAGEVDLLGTANGFEETDPELVMSAAYADDQPMIVTRNDGSAAFVADMAGKKIAMLYHYLPPQSVSHAYPDAELQLYPSTLSAIGAVAFGKADAYLGDAISANYLIGMNYLNNVQLTDFSRLEGSRFAFALSASNTRLLEITNAAIAAIPIGERMAILRRWGSSEMNIPGQNRLHLTPREQRWLEQHPRVTVAAMENFLPLSFFDKSGALRGVSADVLAKVSLRTGLKFDVVPGTSMARQIDNLHSGKVHLLAALTPSFEREGQMRFTRPYLSTPYVLINRGEPGSPATLDDMAGKRLALIRGMFLTDYIASHFPQIQIVYADNAAQVMAMIAKGEVDAGANSLLSARYLISRQYRDRLQVTSTVGIEPARFAFVTNRGELELYAILEKALLSISPEEMAEITNRWRSEVVIDDTFWLRNRGTIIQGFFIAGVLLLLAFLWIAYLRRLIHRREVAERALNNQLEFKRALIDGTPHPIYVRDLEGRMLICNSSYLEVLGLSHEEVQGKRVADRGFADSAEATAFHAEYQQVLRDGVAKIQDRSLVRADGQRLTIYHWMLPYKDSEGAIAGMIAGWIDVSEREQLLGLVQEANRAKTTFLATMSHEIRTPLNAVIGMLELALKKSDQGVLDRFAIEVASGAAHGLLDLIGDILDIARIESGKLSLTPGRANLRELVRSVARIFEGLAQQKYLRLELALDARADCDVSIDPLRFKQVISNLVSNAIKFTAEGEVRLLLEVLADTPGEPLSIRLRVEDSGQGISVEDQQRLFSPFTQASNNNQSGRSGSGLGLAISRTLCEMMGGQLHLSSVLGQGTQIEVLLQVPVLEPLPPEEPSATEEAQQRPLKILVVDDYPANRMLLSKQLGYLGHEMVEAQDGAHGLRAWRKQRFDVVITDCNMPIMNGYALSRAIRAEEADRGLARSLIIGFTANAQPDEKTRCLEAGMDDCLFKPISLESLKQRLDRFDAAVVESPAGQVTAAQTDDIDFASLEKLVRGDQAAMRELLNDLAVSNQQDMARLAEDCSTQDWQELADLAHKVKGGARIVKARRLILACEQMESACEARGDEQDLLRARASLKEEMLVLATALEKYAEA